MITSFTANCQIAHNSYSLQQIAATPVTSCSLLVLSMNLTGCQFFHSAPLRYTPYFKDTLEILRGMKEHSAMWKQGVTVGFTRWAAVRPPTAALKQNRYMHFLSLEIKMFLKQLQHLNIFAQSTESLKAHAGFVQRDADTSHVIRRNSKLEGEAERENVL